MTEPEGLLRGCVEDILPTLPDCSVDAIVGDPPYSYDFMGATTGWDAHESPRAFQEWCYGWSVELLRIVKPGGWVLLFGGTRTFHRLACALEDAGFEMRDTIIAWTYATGFPKSLDISKAIDKRPGVGRHAEFAAELKAARLAAGYTNSFDVSAKVVGRYTGAVANWEKYQWPEAKWWPALRDLLLMDGDKWDPIIAEAERERLGDRKMGRLAVAPGQGADRSAVTLDISAPATDLAKRFDGYGTALKPSWEPILVARRPLVGTVAQNVERWGVGGINVDGCRVPFEQGGTLASNPSLRESIAGGNGGHIIATEDKRRFYTPSGGRWPTNAVFCHHPSCTEDDCVEGCHVATLDGQSGERRAFASQRDLKLTPGSAGDIYGRGVGLVRPGERQGFNDTGGASRFYPCFRFEAKADSAERPLGEDGAGHPTVKPLNLLRFLVRLVSPPDGGLVLDPFLGSGTTAEACINESVRWVGIERDARYWPLIEQRVSRAERGSDPSILAKARRVREAAEAAGQLSFLEGLDR